MSRRDRQYDEYDRNAYQDRDYYERDRNQQRSRRNHSRQEEYSRQDMYTTQEQQYQERDDRRHNESRHRRYDDRGYHDQQQYNDYDRQRDDRRRRRVEEPEPERKSHRSGPKTQPKSQNVDPLWAEARRRAYHDDSDPDEELFQYYYDELSAEKTKKKKKKKAAQDSPFKRGDRVMVTDEGEEYPATVYKYLSKVNMVIVEYDDPEYDREKVPAADVRKADSGAVPKQAMPEPEQPVRHDPPQPRSKQSNHNYRVGEKVEAIFDHTEADPWLPAIVKGTNPLTVVWVGYEDEAPEPIELKDIRKVEEKVEVGDKVSALYDQDGDMYPGVVARLSRDGAYAFIDFEGFEDYEPYQVAIEKVEILEKSAGAAGAAAHDNAAEPEAAIAEDDPNWRPPPPDPAFGNRDAVWLFPEGEEPRRPEELGVRGTGEWANGIKCFVRSYDGYSDTYDLQTADREKRQHRNIAPARIRMCGSPQDQAKCVFAYLKKKLIPKNEFVDTYRMFFFKGGNPDRVRTNRDEKHIFEEVYPKDYKELPDPDWMMWKDDIDLPEIPWWCPPVWDLPYARVATLMEDGEVRKGRIKGYCPFTKLYYLEIRNGDNKTIFKYPKERLTLQKTKRERARELFGFYGKRVMSERLFQGLWRYAIESDRRPPDVDKIIEDNDVRWDEVEEIDGFGIKYIGPDFPKFPEGKGPDGKTDLKTLRTDLPKLFPFDFFRIDGDDIVQEVQDQCNKNPSGLNGKGRVNMGGGLTDGQYHCNVRFFDYGAGREDEHHFECDVWIPEDKIERQMRINDKAEIIFGAFAVDTIAEDDFKLTMHRFFKDRVMNVPKTCEKCEVLEFDEETRSVSWEPGMEGLPCRPDNPLWQNPPRKWKENSKAQFRKNEYEPFKNCMVVKEVEYGSGIYQVTDRDDQTHQVDCIHLRPQIPFVDKVRAVFADNQKEELHMDVVTAGIVNKFGETLQLGDYEIYERLQEKLEDNGFVIEFELHTLNIERIPPKNLMQLWQLKETLSFRQRIDQTFLMCKPEDSDTLTMSFEEFNIKFEEIFDDRINDFARIFENSDKYELDLTAEAISVKDFDRLGGKMDDTISWKDKFEGKEIDWSTAMQNEDYVQRLKQMWEADKEAQAREWSELDKFWENHSVTYHSGRGEAAEKELNNFPRPAFTFDEAFRRYKNDEHVGRVVEKILGQLNSMFNEPTPIQKCCWPAIFSDRDILGISKTGSGKTLTFGLPTIIKVAKQKAMSSNNSFGHFCHALIVVPTRELALQHVQALQSFCEIADLTITALYGGNRNFREQSQSIENGTDIVVATVGRLLHMLNDNILSLKNTTIIILDEADEMLEGFEEAVREVLCNQVRPALERQSLLFSATYADEVMELEHGFYENDPLRICVGSKSIMADKNVRQLFAMTDGFRSNQNALVHCLEFILSTNSKAKVLVFCNNKRECDELNGDFMEMKENNKRELIRHAVWHGDIEQHMREENLHSLKSGQINVILCTDVASRGIDINDLTVVQYGFPSAGGRESGRDDGRERYIHRMGRAGRALKSGTCYIIDSRTPESWGDDLIEILSDVDQVGPPLLYDRCGAKPPCDEEELPLNIPEWAGGPAKADAEVFVYEPGEDDSSYRTLNLFGNGNQLAECLKHFSPEYNPPSQVTLSQLHAEATKAGLLIRIFEAGTAWEAYGDVEAYGEQPEGVTEVFLMHCFGDMTLSNTDHFRPLVENEDWENAIRSRRGKKVRKARVVRSEAAMGEKIVHADWTKKRVNVYWEDDAQTYPATVIDYVDDENVNVQFDDEAFGTCAVAISSLSILGDKVLADVKQSNKVGMTVTAQYPEDGEWYEATVKEDYDNGMFVVEWAVGGESDLEASQIQFPAEEAAAEAAEEYPFKVGPVQAWFGGDDGSYLPAQITRIDDEGYWVTFDGFEADGESCLLEDSLKAAESASKFSVGAVQAWFGGDDGSYLPAKITRIDGEGYHVTYDGFEADGETCLQEDSLKAADSAEAATDQKFPNGPANIYFPDEDSWLPGMIHSFNAGNYEVTYDGFEEVHHFPEDHIQAQAAAEVETKKVTVEYEGEWYDASVKADNGDGTFTIIYDDETFGEETVPSERVKFPEAAASGEAVAASKFSVGPVQAWFGGDDGSYLPAKITRIDGEGYHVTYDGFEADGETCLQEDSLKAAESAEAASGAAEAQKFPNGPANIYYADEDSWLPGQILSFTDGLYAVTYDGFDEVHHFPEDHIQAQKSSAAEKKVAAPSFAFSVGEAGLEGMYAADGEYYAIDITSQNEEGSYQVRYTEYGEDATLMENQIRRAEVEAAASPSFVYSVGQAGLEGLYADDGNYYSIEITAQNEDGSYTVQYTEYGETAILTEDQIRCTEAAASASAPAFAYSAGQQGLEGIYAADGNYYTISISSQNEDGTYQVVYTEYGEEATLPENQIRKIQNVQADSNPPSIAPTEASAAQKMQFSVGEANLEGEYEGKFYAIDILSVNPQNGSYHVSFPEYGEEADLTVEQIRHKTSVEAKPGFSVGEEGLEGLYADDGNYYAIQILADNGDGSFRVIYTEYEEEADLTADQIQRASLATDHSEAAAPEVWQPEQEGVEGKYGDDWFAIRIIANNGDNTYTVIYIDYPDEGEVILQGTEIRRAV